MDSWFVWYIFGVFNALASVGAGVLIGNWLWNRKDHEDRAD